MLAAMDYSFNLNEVANVNGRHFITLLMFLWIALFPILSVYVIFPLFRGKAKYIYTLILFLFVLNCILPSVFLVRSAIFLGQLSQVYYSLLIVFFFNLLAACLLEGKLKKLFYKNDSLYLKDNILPKGAKYKLEYSSSGALRFSSCWILFALILLFITVIAYLVFTLLKISTLSLGFCLFLSVTMIFFHYAFVRWLVRCKICKHPIFELKDDGNQQHKYWFIRVAWLVMRKKPFDCVWCGAHYSAKKISQGKD